MIEKIKQYKDDFKNRISDVGIGDELRQLRTDFLGKKGLVTQVMKDMRELSSEQKREVGPSQGCALRRLGGKDHRWADC